MPIVTILTPTYNRADKLHKLYYSLRNQRSRDFEWMIVDDGSEDDTENIIDSFILDADFPIHYLKKNNGGKHTAVNYGVQYIHTDLTMIVDSDDWLLPNAILEIKKAYDHYPQQNIGSYTFLRQHTDGTSIVALEQGAVIANYIDFRIRGKRPGDMAEVFKTAVLNEYPFPEFTGEHFLSEDVGWIEIAKHYDSVYVDEAIYVCEYLTNGLSANDKKMKFASPLGSMLRGKQLMYKQCGLMANVKGAIIYNCYKRNVRVPIPDSLRLDKHEKILQIFTMPLGVFFHKKWSSV